MLLLINRTTGSALSLHSFRHSSIRFLYLAFSEKTRPIRYESFICARKSSVISSFTFFAFASASCLFKFSDMSLTAAASASAKSFL